MNKRSFIKQSSLTLMIAMCLHTTHAKDYSQFIVFGDSLSDTGNLAHQINNHPSISAIAGTAYGSFTTNPDTTWAGVLADTYGLTAKPNNNNTLTGTNHAIGGAKAQKNETAALGLISIPSVRQQMDNYFNNHTKADPNALYAVWVGANDLLGASSKPITEALMDINTASSAQVSSIKRLHQAGAKTILVPNLPDIGVTPRAAANPSMAKQATLAASTYNRALFSQLNQSDANVIPANTFALLQEATANKEAFGFTNVKGFACKNINSMTSSLGCHTANWQATSTDANQTYAFADDIHPSGRTHRILAQYYHTIIDAPIHIGKVSNEIIKTGLGDDRQIYHQLDRLGDSQHSIWANLQSDNHTSPAIQIGLNVADSSKHTGAYLIHHNQNHTLNKTLSSNIKTIGVGLYHRHDIANIRLNTALGMDRLSIDTHRRIDWEGANRSHTGQTNARRFHVGLQAGYGIDIGKATVRPLIGVHAQQVKVGDLVESEPALSTAMRFGKQEQKSLQGEIGVDVDYIINPTLTLTGGIAHAHEFNDDGRIINAALTSIHEYTKGFNTDINADKSHATTAHLGIQGQLAKANVHAGVHTTHQNGDTNLGGLVGVRFAF